MEAVLQPPRTGMQAFKLMPEGTYCQLINDALIISPAPLVQHARVQSHIFTQLANHVLQAKSGEVYFAAVDVYLNGKNAFQPDIFFISSGRMDIIKKIGIYGAPDLVIEILSSDRKYDLVTKKCVYEKAGVKEFWVVDPESKWCEGFVLEDSHYTSIGVATGQMVIRMFNLHVTFQKGF